MTNNIYGELLKYIKEEMPSFQKIVNIDNTLSLNVTEDEIINYLEFASLNLEEKIPIKGKVIITEGDVLTILKVINSLVSLKGRYTIYINNDNISINTYFVNRANLIIENLNLKAHLIVDYSLNYNKYLDKEVTIVGSEDFVMTAKQDFPLGNPVIL